VTIKLTVPAKPFKLVTVITDDPAEPEGKAMKEGLEVREKSTTLITRWAS